MIRIFLIASMIVFCFTGCAAFKQSPQQRHPANPTTGDAGSQTALDADAYDALIFTHDAIEGTKKDLAAGAYSDTQTVTVKKVLNVTVEAYNGVDSAYKNYHASQTAANAAALQAKLPAMKDATAQLAAAKKGSN